MARDAIDLRALKPRELQIYEAGRSSVENAAWGRAWLLGAASGAFVAAALAYAVWRVTHG